MAILLVSADYVYQKLLNNEAGCHAGHDNALGEEWKKRSVHAMMRA